MTVILVVVLFVNAAFNVFSWPQFLRRVMRDERARDAEGRATAFLKVHIVLVTIALAIALVSVVAGVFALSQAG